MMNNNYSPIRENTQEGTENYFYQEEPSLFCGCFRFPCFQSKEGEANSLLQQQGEDRDSWMVTKMKELKEYSELVAGPKWKNFVRKMGKYCNSKKSKGQQFQYDSDSYAMNFDEGVEENDDGLLRNFSTRFAAPAPFSVVNNNNNNNNTQRNAGL
ncbi:uncharacterized protein [Nicotiana sylvestris]|uniref:Uncharacterized protein LOC104221130 n=1 Tax=Nicotiana sylvestris TaxID=4096 RepID=A0A1U7VVK8_NICSY|nr:PREDICTED: uncharacterized protein LOC104221130 [Nicotiana sylvestris]